MTRQVAIGLGVMVVITLVSLAYLFDVTEMVQFTAGLEEPDAGFPELEEPLFEPTDPPLEIRMFFPATNNDVLIRTRRMMIYESATLENQARQIVEQLIAGPGNNNLFSGLPSGTGLNQLFISEDGVAYVDFNSALSDNHPGGILSEQATVYSIVNSLVYNLDGINRVKILVGGAEKETLAGHCLLLLPLQTDLSITDIAFQAELEAEEASQTP
jgi:hypothetical protein